MTDAKWEDASRLEAWAGEVRVNLIRSLALVVFYANHLLNVYVWRDPNVDGAFHAAVTAVVDSAAQADTEYLLEEIPRAIRQSLEGLERVAKIVRSMKEFSHPGGEEMQAIDLNRAIESTLTVSRNEWKYVADVATDFDPQLPMVDCLPGEINQVVLNLIVNAAHAIADKVRDAAGQRGTITVRTCRDGDWATIAVADTGTGIPLAIQGRVFDPFFTTKEVGRGTGQGLAIAHSVVTDKHGGTIRFESQPGEGTTFFIRLPIHAPEPRTRGVCPELKDPRDEEDLVCR